MKVKGKYIYDETVYNHGKRSEEKKEQIEKIRKDFKMADLKSGERSCLKCDTVFISEDLKNQKTCAKCRRKSK